MYMSIVVSRNELCIEHRFFKTKEDAIAWMLHDIEGATGDKIDEVKKNLDDDEGEYIDDDGACIQTNHVGTICYTILEVPKEIPEDDDDNNVTD